MKTSKIDTKIKKFTAEWLGYERGLDRINELETVSDVRAALYSQLLEVTKHAWREDAGRPDSYESGKLEGRVVALTTAVAFLDHLQARQQPEKKQP